VVRVFALALIAIATVTAAAACGSSGSTTPTGQAPRQTFASQHYGFRVTLPLGNWLGQDAQTDWDAKSLAGDNNPAFAVLTDAATDRKVIVASAPTGMALPEWRAAMVRARPQGCSESSSAAQPSSLGGEPALTWTADCSTEGFDVIKLAALHGTHGYIILLATPHPSDAANDRRSFESIRRSFRFTR
jgi:hypothetical protein